ncbi:growth hormone-regulated TBC protein 1 [Selaginella moellendorffii]|nr:growth hormone-regulated TBC protein 1 [Selaginella moellendorffii]|eukprot:XP_002961883.2 growth hormone-regulated TBC protein 1 [Selaginella moellendorffii]
MKRRMIQIRDLHCFTVDVCAEDAAVVERVKDRVRERGRQWWELEASKGAAWYLHCQAQQSLSFIAAFNAIQLRMLIRKGIPPQLRPRIWLFLSGAAKKRSTVPHSYYKDLVDAVRDKTTAATRQIDHDLDRTFPTHPWLSSPAGQQTLRRVLVAYSFRDSRVGYCQGMNFVAGLLLVVMKTEEDAFWMLAVLLENVLLSDTYSDNLYGCHIEQRVFKELLRKKCTRLALHFEAMDFDVSLLTTEWFLCLFAKTLPSETTMRIWDVLFNEGAKVLFRFALGILKMKEEELLPMKHADELVKVVQDFARRSFDPDVLFKVAFDKVGSMTMQTIDKHRRKQQPAVMAELAGRSQRIMSSSWK